MSPARTRWPVLLLVIVLATLAVVSGATAVAWGLQPEDVGSAKEMLDAGGGGSGSSGQESAKAPAATPDAPAGEPGSSTGGQPAATPEAPAQPAGPDPAPAPVAAAAPSGTPAAVRDQGSESGDRSDGRAGEEPAPAAAASQPAAAQAPPDGGVEWDRVARARLLLDEAADAFELALKTAAADGSRTPHPAPGPSAEMVAPEVPVAKGQVAAAWQGFARSQAVVRQAQALLDEIEASGQAAGGLDGTLGQAHELASRAKVQASRAVDLEVAAVYPPSNPAALATEPGDEELDALATGLNTVGMGGYVFPPLMLADGAAAIVQLKRGHLGDAAISATLPVVGPLKLLRYEKVLTIVAKVAPKLEVAADLAAHERVVKGVAHTLYSQLSHDSVVLEQLGQVAERYGTKAAQKVAAKAVKELAEGALKGEESLLRLRRVVAEKIAELMAEVSG